MEFEAKIFAIDIKEETVSFDINPDDIMNWVNIWKKQDIIKISIQLEGKE